MTKRKQKKTTQPQPDPDKHYEVEALLGKKRVKGKNEYLVKWENSWELEENLDQEVVGWVLVESRHRRGKLESLVKWENSWQPEENLDRETIEWFEKNSHKVVALLERRLGEGENEYLVKWKDASVNDSWEPESNIDRMLVVDFEIIRKLAHNQKKKGHDPKHNQKKSSAPARKRKTLKRLAKKE